MDRMRVYSRGKSRRLRLDRGILRLLIRPQRPPTSSGADRDRAATCPGYDMALFAFLPDSLFIWRVPKVVWPGIRGLRDALAHPISQPRDAGGK